VLAAFLLGFGATIAEPALRALAVTVEGLAGPRLESGVGDMNSQMFYRIFLILDTEKY